MRTALASPIIDECIEVPAAHWWRGGRIMVTRLFSQARLGLLFVTLLAAVISDAVPARAAASQARNPFLAIDRHFEQRVARGEMAGIVILIARRGRLVHTAAIGFADREHHRKMSMDTIFRLYSMTKPLTAAALMILHDEGRFRLDDPLARYLPEFSKMRVLGTGEGTVPADRPITIEDVLRHTAGFALGLGADRCNAPLMDDGIYRSDLPLSAMIKRVAKRPLCKQPETVWNYSLGPDVQARLVEVLSGMSFAEFLEKRLLTPLGMRDTRFTLSGKRRNRLAQIYGKSSEGLVPWSIEMLPESSSTRRHPPFVTIADPTIGYERGSLGLYGTARDYLAFARMLLNRGQYNNRQIFSPNAVYLMSHDRLGTIPMEFPTAGLGFGLGLAVVRDPVQTGALGNPGLYYWNGAAATIFWVDPSEDLAVVALTQHLGVSGLGPGDLQAEMQNLVYGTLR
jgi:CubicO group peptidase (beta-lactamase class C family)